jgi:hypothetical protein
MAARKHELLDIRKFVLPSARELIMDCWTEEPADRLKEIRFKVMRNVNSTKLSAFVEEIEG